MATTIVPVSPTSLTRQVRPISIPAGSSATLDQFEDSRGRAAAGPSGRGRDPSPKALPNLNDRSPPPGPALALPAMGRRISATQLAAPAFHAHHQPPPATAPPNEDPILYLPPLLSGLPHGVKHEDPTHPRNHEFDTRLPDIDPASLALHQALHYFRPNDAQYAATEYNEAFNWDELALPSNVEREWYGVVFRSRRRPESSSLSLYAADRAAHAEAVSNGGLVLYWYGVPDVTGLNLATCIWQSRSHAINAIAGPKHIEAMKQARGAYETYDLERWIIRKRVGKKTLELERWVEGEVGW
ncbi:uncharacterized protein EHS24_007742 [Apiotrichum porosum]|uniref:Uncharacterized protein n=1 Tax=Apiotrichum porosum TaxID=105984 RepID=A0A427XV33_9TREE|nr:uncharacterized protein EHS24_007742 [Apiotrichum porosum]RSH82748.1 hypothetical protein EHS24_007742 [Apiotrichum porosum]